MDTDPSHREKLSAVYETFRFRPGLGSVIVFLGFITASLEGIGLGFLIPIVEIAQSSSPPANADGIIGGFVRVYALLGVPLTLEYLIVGVLLVMAIKVSLSFLATWLSSILSLSYQRHLRKRLFDAILTGSIEYIDEVGSDTLLNSLITETQRASVIVMAVFGLVGTVLRGLVYLAIAAVLSPVLTLIALIALTISTVTVRYILEPAYTAGEFVAETNDRMQSVAQTTIQGMRDVRLFNMQPELRERVHTVLDDFVDSGVRLRRNKAILNNLNQFANITVIFALVYIGFNFTNLSLSGLGVFLFAVFRLSPVINELNNKFYRIDGQLPQLIRVLTRIDELDEHDSIEDDGTQPVTGVEQIVFDTVSFGYQVDEPVLEDVSFSVEKGETIAFVGPSGAGKSTIASLLSRLQTPDSGQIYADDIPIDQFKLNQWRGQLAVVRQNPFLFDGTLKSNITIANREATNADIQRVCETAQVTEFLDDLPNGYETELGEDGVRLSGGQKQRVAIARALLKDADVLILDEATSELDSNIEQEVYRRISAVEHQYATISIAHRLSTVRDADQIYTLVGGAVAESGTHEQLVSAGGPYSELYTTQS
jgi:subfamily B ATP-binding cassette protein MsbA